MGNYGNRCSGSSYGNKSSASRSFGRRKNQPAEKLFTVRVGRTKFKVLASNLEEANYIAGQTLGGVWSDKIKESWSMD